MAYEVAIDGKAAEIRLHGELTFAQHRKFRHVVVNLERTAPEQVVLDLSNVEYIDAAGLGLLLVARDTVSGKGGAVELRGAQGQVGRMLEVSRISNLFQAA
ncbi:MAG TPA: STAS domain-containing protein [Magnetospirillum sp.]|nr:STAS domain-containing protein [Magnetospirillum sp.]